MALGIGSLGTGLCTCICHQADQETKHVKPCCAPCATCGANVSSIPLHEANCPAEGTEIIEESTQLLASPFHRRKSSLKHKERLWLFNLSDRLWFGLARRRACLKIEQVPKSERVCNPREINRVKRLISERNLVCKMTARGRKKGVALHVYEHGLKGPEDFRHIFTMTHEHLLAPRREKPEKAFKIFNALVCSERNLVYYGYYSLRTPKSRARSDR